MALVGCLISACLLKEVETSKKFLWLVTLGRYKYSYMILLDFIFSM